MIIKYCTNCLMPSTKPYITFDKKGICNACESNAKKSNNKNKTPIDWAKREEEFEELIQWVKNQ